MSYSTATGIIKIPVLFDMSGDAVVYGEEATGDFVTSHLDFLLDMTTEANDISLNAADISAAILIGDHDTGDNIFYSGGSSGNVAVDNLCNRIAKAITRGKLVHIPKSGDHSNSGIPMGGRSQLVDTNGNHTIYDIQNEYTSKYTTSIAPIGDEQMLGQAMARVASIHLVGSPLAAGIFEDKNQIQTDLETASTQTFNDGNTAFYNALAVQLSKVLGGSKSSAPMNNGSGSGSGGGGSAPDLTSQVLYENFEDNAYTGDVTTATIVSGGYNSSNYALQGGGKNNYNRWRINTTTYQSVSFWYYRDSANSGSNMEVLFDNNRQTNGINSLFFKNAAGHSEEDKISFMSQNSAVSKLYVNGVDQSSAITTTWESSYTPITYADLTWHHFYIEFSSATNMPATFGQPDDGGSTYTTQYDRWGGGGKFDEVRFFNTALHTLQIADLAAGNNGNVTIPVVTLPSAVALINMDGTTHSRERNDSYGVANIIDNDDSTFTYMTTTATTVSHAPFILKFSFSAQDVGKTLKQVAFGTNPTDNHSMSGLKFGILNGTTYTSLNVISGTNLGTGATLTTGTVTWDNDTNWHISNYPVNQSTEVSLNDYTIQSNDHLVVRWLASTMFHHFTLSYFKFSLSGSGTPTPYDIASVNSQLSGQVYSSSSNLSTSYDATGAFNSDTTGYNAWATESGKYSGTYNGSESTSGYTGEWIQVDIGQSVVLTSYSFKTKDNVNDDYDVKKMRLFSSNDGTNWTQIQDWTNLTAADWATGNTVGPYNAPANTTGRYFRLAINELQATAGVYGVIAVFDLNGYINPGGSSGGGSVQPYDIASSNSTLSGQTYTGSSLHSSTDFVTGQKNHSISGAFNGITDENVNSWVSGDNTYLNGSHNTSESTSGYAGEWIQVDIGQTVVAKEFTFYTRNVTNRDDNDAKKMRLFSSNDGSNWTQVYDWTNLTTLDWRVSAAGVPKPLTINQTATGRYFRLAINELMGSVNYAQIAEFEIKGITPAEEASNASSGGSSGGGSSGGSSGGYPLDASGVAVPALKSIYEQLMNVPGRSQIMQTRDISGTVDNSNVTLAGGFPFISGDKLVMYLRPKIVFAAQTKAEQSTTLVGFSQGVTLNTPVFNVGRSGQGITGQTYSQSSVYTGQYGADKASEGTVSGGYGYLGSVNFDNTTGAYNKATPDNTSVDGANLAGEWLQVNVGKKVAVTSYKIYPQNWEKHSIGGRSPHIFKLVYSDDGTNFLTADSQTVGTDNLDTSEWASDNTNSATYIPKTFTLTNTKVGQYWRLIITSLYGNGYSNGGTVAIQELELNGSDDYTGDGDSGGIDLSGIQTNIVATAENIEDAFPGNENSGIKPEINKWGWMGSTNSDSLTLETTDSTDPRTCDLHIWKITITL